MAAMAVEEKLCLGSKQNLGVSPPMLFPPFMNIKLIHM